MSAWPPRRVAHRKLFCYFDVIEKSRRLQSPPNRLAAGIGMRCVDEGRTTVADGPLMGFDEVERMKLIDLVLEMEVRWIEAPLMAEAGFAR